ncbi:MAG: thiamine phosphate synthase [Dehalococcoidia bacterium]
MASRPKNLQRISGLYVILDPSFCKGISEIDAARAIIRGGARIIQWRDKARDKGVQLPILREVNGLCSQAGVLSIVNDHLDLAIISGADGLHVGQNDLPLTEVKPYLPDDKIVGVSTANVEEALRAQEQGAGYIAVGSIYPTSSKDGTRPAGLETLRRVAEAVSVPVVAIGGINLDNVGPVIDAGADAVCVISAVLSAPDIEKAARDLVSGIASRQSLR